MPESDDSAAPTVLDAHQLGLVEEMGLVWADIGGSRMQGRILGYLMFSNSPHVSTAELCTALKASAGSISSATRRLLEISLILQVAVAGERSHFYCATDDLWGTFLELEHKNDPAMIDLADRALSSLDVSDEHPRARFQNMRDYHEWLSASRQSLFKEWQEYKRLRAASPTAPKKAARK